MWSNLLTFYDFWVWCHNQKGIPHCSIPLDYFCGFLQCSYSFAFYIKILIHLEFILLKVLSYIENQFYFSSVATCFPQYFLLNNSHLFSSALRCDHFIINPWWQNKHGPSLLSFPYIWLSLYELPICFPYIISAASFVNFYLCHSLFVMCRIMLLTFHLPLVLFVPEEAVSDAVTFKVL